MSEREEIAQILRDNLSFSSHVGDYVIHGAINKIIEWADKRKKPSPRILPAEYYQKKHFIEKRIAEQREYVAYILGNQDLVPARKNLLVESALGVKNNLEAELAELNENYT